MDIATLNNITLLAPNWRQRLCAALCILSIGTGASLAPAQTLDQIIAIVDDDIVLASELEERLAPILAQISASGKSAPPEEIVRKDLLNQLIVESIQLQMAERAGVRVNDAQLNEYMGRIAAQNGMDLAQFKQALEAEGRDYNETREQIRREMLIQRVQGGHVNQRVQISDKEISNFLASQAGQALTAPEYRLLHLRIALPSAASDADIERARARALQIQDKALSGQSLKQIDSQASDLGWRKSEDLPSLFTDIAPVLKRGETSKPIYSSSGFHLITLLDKRGDGELIAQTRARHILLKPSAIQDDKATRAAITALRQRILNGEDFAQLARQHSEDIGSAQEGGDLGWTNPGQLVPEFEQAMAATAIDAISEPFRSGYGWHIVQVLDRREKDVTDELRRNMARSYLHKRKFDDELTVWLQKIRDEAYVDIK